MLNTLRVFCPSLSVGIKKAQLLASRVAYSTKVVVLVHNLMLAVPVPAVASGQSTIGYNFAQGERALVGSEDN